MIVIQIDELQINQYAVGPDGNFYYIEQRTPQNIKDQIIAWQNQIAVNQQGIDDLNRKIANFQAQLAVAP